MSEFKFDGPASFSFGDLTFGDGEVSFTVEWAVPEAEITRLAEELMRVAGCAQCGVVVFGTEAHLCEHGVVPGLKVDITFDYEYDDNDLYRRLAGP